MEQPVDKVVQYIICRSDLNMSHGKMSAQVAHASLGSVYQCLNDSCVKTWLSGAFTKIVLQAKNFHHLEKLSLQLIKDGIVHREIWDNCLTELQRETPTGTLTCVGIIPLPKSKIYPYVKRYQLY